MIRVIALTLWAMMFSFKASCATQVYNYIDINGQKIEITSDGSSCHYKAENGDVTTFFKSCECSSELFSISSPIIKFELDRISLHDGFVEKNDEHTVAVRASTSFKILSQDLGELFHIDYYDPQATELRFSTLYSKRIGVIAMKKVHEGVSSTYFLSSEKGFLDYCN